MAYATGSLIGADLNNTSTTQLFALGQTTLANNGARYMYVYFATAVTAYCAVCVTTGFTATSGGTTNLLAGMNLAWTQATAANADYGWVAYEGHVGVMTSGSATATPQGVYLPGASGTAGIISNNYSASGTLQGVFFTSVAQTATATVTGAILFWPRGSAAAFY